MVIFGSNGPILGTYEKSEQIADSYQFGWNLDHLLSKSPATWIKLYFGLNPFLKATAKVQSQQGQKHENQTFQIKIEIKSPKDKNMYD